MKQRMIPPNLLLVLICTVHKGGSRAAFYKCETNVLLHTLRESGVKGKFGKWIAAFLDPKTRKQAVGVDGKFLI